MLPSSNRLYPFRLRKLYLSKIIFSFKIYNFCVVIACHIIALDCATFIGLMCRIHEEMPHSILWKSTKERKCRNCYCVCSSFPFLIVILFFHLFFLFFFFSLFIFEKKYSFFSTLHNGDGVFCTVRFWIFCLSISLNTETTFFSIWFCIETPKNVVIVEQRHTHSHKLSKTNKKNKSNCNKGKSFSFWKIKCDDVQSVEESLKRHLPWTNDSVIRYSLFAIRWLDGWYAACEWNIL